MESSTGFSQAPLKWGFPIFHYRNSSFCCLPIFSLKKPPPKGTQYFNRSQHASSHYFSTSKVHAVSTDPDVPPLTELGL